PFSAGGTTDIAARVLSKTASKYLPTSQTIVVINKPGVSGTMGISDLLKADPDGYTLMLGASTGFSQSPYIVPNIKFD
ncbi:MAG: tripartite tricarboxylate transporter substrate-binding protein, partial [Oscillospiraceae bacterium]